ncbi:hypothetical protein EPO05_06615 [Patescibacteria group bacterium]|nr:MAG: hypothetical protein EPO05_06615 [Patescibacteria group bacterium]
MNERFLIALQNIEKADPNTIVGQILEIFSRISIMSREEATAAYQTVRFFVTKLDVNDNRRVEVSKITDAVVNRMLEITALTDKRQRVAVATHFEQLVQVVAYRGKFHELLETLDARERYYARRCSL